MPENTKIADLRKYALGLLWANLFMSYKDKKDFERSISLMKIPQIQKFISILEGSRKDAEGMLAEYFKKHPDGGDVLKKFKQLKKVSTREISSADKKTDEKKADLELEEALKAIK